LKKSVRFAIYVGLLAFAWFILFSGYSFNTTRIGALITTTVNGMNTLSLSAVAFAIALVITYLVTSGWGLILLGALALVGLAVVAILHPYLFPLLIPMFALWLFCAAARRKESSAAKHAPSKHAPSKHA
jgi:hypothetical protein